MKKFICIFLTVCTIFSLVGCSGAGGISTYTIPVSNMPSCFDPQIATNENDLLLLTNIFDGLFEKHNGKIVNNLATDCVISDNGKKYTISISDDSIFHCKNDKEKLYDGTFVTAHDFVFALTRILLPETKSPYSDDFINIKGAKSVLSGDNISNLGVYAIDDHTLVIELETPDYNFQEKLCLTAAYPCNKAFFDSTMGSYGLKVNNILSNGPFRLNYLDGEQATIVKNSDSKAELERIRLVLVEENSQLEAFSNENISGFFTYGNQINNLSNTNNISFESDIFYLVFNIENELFSNEKIRQALSYYAYAFENSGANMRAIIPTESIFPKILNFNGNPLYEIINTKRPDFMTQNAKSLYLDGINELSNSNLHEISLLIPTDSIYRPIFENINQIWQKDLNCYFKIEYLTTAEIQSRINQNFDIAFLPMSPKTDSIYSILDKYAFNDIQIQELLSNAKSKINQSEAVDLLSTIENIILNKAYIIPLCAEKTTYYYNSVFKNVIVDPFSKTINLKHTTIS